jgi:hypothetical protein
MTWFYVINDMLEHCLPSVVRAMIPAASHQMEAVNSQAFNEKVLAFSKHWTACGAWVCRWHFSDVSDHADDACSSE